MTDATLEPATDEDAATTALVVAADHVPEIGTMARASIFLPVPWEELELAAKMIATAPGLAAELASPQNALFVAYQAARWGMDPVMVATKVFFTEKNGAKKVAYEAQLITAIIEADPALQRPLLYEFAFAGDQKTAVNRFCKCTGVLRAKDGEIVTRSITTPTIGQVKVKNSPLWFSDPDQQLSYYAGRAFARRYRSARILGVYARDELDAFEQPEPAQRNKALFEEDEDTPPAFEGIPPTAEQQSANGATRDPRDDPKNAAPPDATGNEPPDLAEIKTWAEGERVRLIAMTDPAALATAGEALIRSRRFRRLISYDQAEAKRIDNSIHNRIDELNT